MENKEPKVLDTKVSKKFAWLPVLIEDNYYWLGFYYAKYRYQDGGYYNTFAGPFEGDKHASGKETVFTSPHCFGNYSYGGKYWVLIGISLNEKDLPVHEVDNFYSK